MKSRIIFLGLLALTLCGCAGTATTSKTQAAGGTSPTRGFHLTNFGDALDLYQEASGRTILSSPQIAEMVIDVSSKAVLSQRLVTVLDQVFTDHGCITKNFDDKFVLIIPDRASAVFEQVAPPPLGTTGEKWVPGALRFVGADPLQILDVYQEISGRTVLRPSTLPAASISVRSQTALTQEENIWVMETALVLAGIAMIPEKNNFIFALPLNAKEKLSGLKPHGAIIKKETLTFNDAKVESVLETYARLLGREAQTQPNAASTRISLRPQKDLTFDEAIYALEAVGTTERAAIHSRRRKQNHGCAAYAKG